jgi:hypothetical protein
MEHTSEEPGAARGWVRAVAEEMPSAARTLLVGWASHETPLFASRPGGTVADVPVGPDGIELGPEEESRVDVVVCGPGIAVALDTRQLLAQVVDLAPGGKVFIAVENPTALPVIAALAEDRVAPGPGSSAAPETVFCFSAPLLAGLLDQVGCRNITVRPWGDSGTVAAGPEEDTVLRSGRVRVHAGGSRAAFLHASALLVVADIPDSCPPEHPSGEASSQAHLVGSALSGSAPSAEDIPATALDALSKVVRRCPPGGSTALLVSTGALVPTILETVFSGAGGHLTPLVLSPELVRGVFPTLPGGAFDVIVVVGCLERVVDPEVFLTHLTRLLSSTGSLFALAANLATVDVLGALAAGTWVPTPGVLRGFTRLSLLGLAGRCGLDAVHVEPCGAVPAALAGLPEQASTTLRLGPLEVLGVTHQRGQSLGSRQLLLTAKKPAKRPGVGTPGAPTRILPAGQGAALPVPEATIVVCVRDEAALLAALCTRMSTHAPRSAFDLSIVDNGSRDSVGELRSTPNGSVTVEHNLGDVGLAAGWNQAVASSRGRVVVLADRGMEPTAGWLDALLASLEKNPKLSLVAPVIRAPDGSVLSAGVDVLEVSDGSLRLLSRRPASLPEGAGPILVPALAPVVVAVRREVFDALGPLEERLCGGDEIVDLCLRAWEAGGAVAVEPAASVVLRDAPRPLLRMQLAQSAAVLAERWVGGLPPLPTPG